MAYNLQLNVKKSSGPHTIEIWTSTSRYWMGDNEGCIVSGMGYIHVNDSVLSIFWSSSSNSQVTFISVESYWNLGNNYSR